MPKSVEEVSQRANELRALHADRLREKTRIRALMDGGREAVQALLGDVQGLGDDLPTANLMLSGITRLGQKLGRRPDLRVDPPNETDSERARKRAEKRERIVEAYDEACWMDVMLPQVGRWLPGYSYAVWVIRERTSPDGFRYPHVELRDPYDSFPAPWGADNQPADLAVFRRIEHKTLESMYPDVAAKIKRRVRGPGGAVMLGGPNTAGIGGAGGGWENASGQGVNVAEYYDDDGYWLVAPDHEQLLEHIPNVLTTGPQFVVAKRYAFNKLAGQYDHVIGLMAMMAKLNLLAQVGMEDSTFSETNIFGEPPAGQYKRGRFAINVFPPGTSVQKMQHNLPYQQFEQINRIERQFRLTAGYPVTDDAQSPNSYVTGQGLQELTSAITQEVHEYQGVLSRHLELIDSKRLEWDENAYGDERKPMYGVRKGEPFSESYTPKKDIAGGHRTRRVYGMMAGWDEPQKIVAGLQLMQGGIISTQTMQENLDGLDNVTREQERIRDQNAEQAVLQMILAHSNNPESPEHMRAFQMAVELLNAGPVRELAEKWLTERGQELSEQERAMVEPPQQEMAAPPGPPPDVSTVLSRLTQGGDAQGGIQTVGRLPGRG